MGKYYSSIIITNNSSRNSRSSRGSGHTKVYFVGWKSKVLHSRPMEVEGTKFTRTHTLTKSEGYWFGEIASCDTNAGVSTFVRHSLSQWGLNLCAHVVRNCAKGTSATDLKWSGQRVIANARSKFPTKTLAQTAKPLDGTTLHFFLTPKKSPN